MREPLGFKKMFALVVFIASCMMAMAGMAMFVVRDPKIATCWALIGLVVGLISGICVDNLFSDEESGRLPTKKDCHDSESG